MSDFRVEMEQLPTPEELIEAVKRCHAILPLAIQSGQPVVMIRVVDLQRVLVAAALWINR